MNVKAKDGCKSKGRPKSKWVDCIKDGMKSYGKKTFYSVLKYLGKDKREERKLLVYGDGIRRPVEIFWALANHTCAMMRVH